MQGIAAQPIWQLEVVLPTSADCETFGMALEDLSFAAAAFEMVPDEGPWQLQLFCDGMPDADEVARRVALAAVQAGMKAPDYVCMPLPEKDWVAENQKSFRPIRAGRFFVYSSYFEEEGNPLPAGSWNLCIDAATAFGTGEHGTTKGCLQAIHDLSKHTDIVRPLDVGCGTGILAMGVAKAWPVTVMASDIDPEAVRVTRFNVKRNKLGKRVNAVTSAGFRHRALKDNGPYDLIVANILANPLRRMARDLAVNLLPGGYVILSGLLVDQERMVMEAYRTQGLVLAKRYRINGWSTLVLQGR